MSTSYFRSAPIYGTTQSTDKSPVDREAGIIHGASAMQAGEAKGKGVAIDAKTLQQICDLGNASASGIKVRFAHPEPKSDALGTSIGRMREFSVSGDKVIGNVYANKSAANSPRGDLRSYVLDLASEDPESFGMSVEIDGGAVWMMSDGSEVAVTDPSKPPAGAVGLPVLRVSKFKAVAVVDDPAANRDGLFSETAGNPVVTATVTVSESITTTGEPPGKKKETNMDIEELSAFAAEHPGFEGLILKMGKQPKAEIISAIKDAKFAALEQSVKDMQMSADKSAKEHAATLAAKDEQFAKSQAELAEAKKQAAFALNAGKDPGADASAQADGDALKKEWEAMSAPKKSGYFNKFEAFVEARAFEIKDRLMAGKGE